MSMSHSPSGMSAARVGRVKLGNRKIFHTLSHLWSSGCGMIKPALYLFMWLSSFAACSALYQYRGQAHRQLHRKPFLPFFVLAAAVVFQCGSYSLLGLTAEFNESINNPGEQLISQLSGTRYPVVFQARAFSPPPTC